MPRKNHGDELWRQLVNEVSVDDGLPCFDSPGIWTAKKPYFLCQYLEQTTRGMKARRGFPSGLTYIDLFCGAGVSTVRSPDGRVRRYPGSPVIAASTPEAFDRLVLVDIDDVKLDATRQRLDRLGRLGRARLVSGDANKIIDQVVAMVPHDSLNVAFVDPYSLDVHFETIRRLAEQRALDLVILFSDRFDLGRNVHHYY